MKIQHTDEMRWRDIAEHVYYIRENTSLLFDLINYRVHTKTIDRAIKIERLIDQLRSDLEEEMWRQGIRDTSIFYPGGMTSDKFYERGLLASSLKESKNVADGSGK